MIQRMLLLLCGAATLAVAADQFQSLFNGKDLSGWEVDTPGVWSVNNGMIVGKASALKHNDFLRTRRKYRDFTLKISFRLVDGAGNSGIQFRSVPVAQSHEISGYQADIGETYWGCLYDESRRRKVIAQASAAAVAGLNKDGWNTYLITAKGNHITLSLNGIRSVDYEEKEPGMDIPGIIALQVHSGPRVEVHFKDILIQEH